MEGHIFLADSVSSVQPFENHRHYNMKTVKLHMKLYKSHGGTHIPDLSFRQGQVAIITLAVLPRTPT